MLKSFLGYFSNDLSIDLGTANTLIYVRGRGIVLSEPSIVAFDRTHQSVIAVGQAAKAMLGRTPGHIEVVRPLKDGVIADFDVAQTMLRQLIARVHPRRRIVRPRIVVGVPSGVTQVEKALDKALSKAAASGRDVRIADLSRAGVPETLARRVANLSVLKAAPDIALVADRAGKPVGEVTATYFATEAFFQLDSVASAVPNIVVSDYFDRLALDRALDSIGDAERRLTAAMVANNHTGADAVEEWVRPRQAEVERIRSAIHQIAESGLTLSKLSVAASLLGDLARQ